MYGCRPFSKMGLRNNSDRDVLLAMDTSKETESGKMKSGRLAVAEILSTPLGINKTLDAMLRHTSILSMQSQSTGNRFQSRPSGYRLRYNTSTPCSLNATLKTQADYHLPP